jgi:hypothetical protein
MLSFALIGLSYMLGEIFQLSALKGWYRSELWESTKTMMLVAVIFSVLVIFSSIASSLAGTGSAPASLGTTGQISQNLGGLYAVAGNYLTVASQNATNSMLTLFGAASQIDFLKSFRISVWFPIPTLIGPETIAFHFGADTPIFISNLIDAGPNSSSLLSNAATLVVLPTLIMLQSLSNLFYDIVALGFGLFIPLGLVFRAIPFLRGFGGTFIAIGLTLSLVLPMIFVTVNIPVSDLVLGQGVYCTSGSQSVCSAIAAASGSSSGSSCNTAYSQYGAILDAILGFLGCISSNISSTLSSGSAFSTGYNVASATFSETSIYPIADLVTSIVLNSVLQFILLIVDFIIGYTIAKAIAQQLGGTIRLGFGKMRMA